MNSLHSELQLRLSDEILVKNELNISQIELGSEAKSSPSQITEGKTELKFPDLILIDAE
jgi:hypothetical protein